MPIYLCLVGSLSEKCRLIEYLTKVTTTMDIWQFQWRFLHLSDLLGTRSTLYVEITIYDSWMPWKCHEIMVSGKAQTVSFVLFRGGVHFHFFHVCCFSFFLPCLLHWKKKFFVSFDSLLSVHYMQNWKKWAELNKRWGGGHWWATGGSP